MRELITWPLGDARICKGGDLAAMEYGDDSGRLASATAQMVCCSLAHSAKHRILIHSYRLERDWYDQPCFLEAAKALALRHPSTRIRVLVADTEDLRVSGSRLLDLSFRLSSSIEFRKRQEADLDDQSSFMLVDDFGILRRPLWTDSRNTEVFESDRPLAAKLASYFVDVWERADIDPALRQLHL